MNGDRIRILIADDHPIFRDGMRGLLDSVADTEVVGEATTGEEAIARAASLQPDVILMDLKMPGMNGIEATRQILYTSPHIAVLVVTMLEDDDYVFAYRMRGGLAIEGWEYRTKDEALAAVAAERAGLDSPPQPAA